MHFFEPPETPDYFDWVPSYPKAVYALSDCIPTTTIGTWLGLYCSNKWASFKTSWMLPSTPQTTSAIPTTPSSITISNSNPNSLWVGSITDQDPFSHYIFYYMMNSFYFNLLHWSILLFIRLNYRTMFRKKVLHKILTPILLILQLTNNIILKVLHHLDELTLAELNVIITKQCKFLSDSLLLLLILLLLLQFMHQTTECQTTNWLVLLD